MAGPVPTRELVNAEIKSSPPTTVPNATRAVEFMLKMFQFPTFEELCQTENAGAQLGMISALDGDEGPGPDRR